MRSDLIKRGKRPPFCTIHNCAKRCQARGMCSTHYWQWWRHQEPEYHPRTLSLPDRFWPKVDKSSGLFGCWPYLEHCNDAGYGQVKVGRTPKSASVVAWALMNGRWPQRGEVVRHHCDNPPCCNPLHLVIGSYKDNIQDSIARGRFTQFGAGRPGRFSVDDIRAIRSRWPKESFMAIGRSVGMSAQLISDIVHRKAYARVH